MEEQHPMKMEGAQKYNNNKPNALRNCNSNSNHEDDGVDDDHDNDNDDHDITHSYGNVGSDDSDDIPEEHRRLTVMEGQNSSSFNSHNNPSDEEEEDHVNISQGGGIAESDSLLHKILYTPLLPDHGHAYVKFVRRVGRILMMDFTSSSISTADHDDMNSIMNGSTASLSSSRSQAGRESGRHHQTPTTTPSFTMGNKTEIKFIMQFLKFVTWTFLLIGIMHAIVPHITDDRDINLKLWHIWVFDGQLIISDLLIFFIVGRMYQHTVGIDHVAFILYAILANVYFQLHPYLTFLQNSVSLYAMHCVWPWQLWVFVAFLIPLIGSIVYLHVIHAYKKRIILQKITEILICGILFVAPVAPSPYFHCHHWFAGWLLGMHCNFYDKWWSRAIMAYCWGMYINGIAVYGRDPVLTCEYAYYLSVDLRCPYIECYIEGLANNDSNETNHTYVKPMIAPDWKNCSADSYHP